MARTKQTARKSSGGKAPRGMLQATSARQFRQFMTSRQQATYSSASSSPAQQQKTSYLVRKEVMKWAGLTRTVGAYYLWLGQETI